MVPRAALSVPATAEPDIRHYRKLAPAVLGAALLAVPEGRNPSLRRRHSSQSQWRRVRDGYAPAHQGDRIRDRSLCERPERASFR
jgi:hypothetical protein